MSKGDSTIGRRVLARRIFMSIRSCPAPVSNRSMDKSTLVEIVLPPSFGYWNFSAICLSISQTAIVTIRDMRLFCSLLHHGGANLRRFSTGRRSGWSPGILSSSPSLRTVVDSACRLQHEAGRGERHRSWLGVVPGLEIVVSRQRTWLTATLILLD